MRHPSTLVAVPLAVLALAGCTANSGGEASGEASSTPRPTPSSELCSPVSATETEWGELTPAEPAEVGFRTLTIDAEGNLTATTEAASDYESTVTRDVPGGETGWSDPENIEALIESAKADGVGPDELGDPVIDFDASGAEPSGPGEYVTGYRLEQSALAFTLRCGDGLTGEGVLTTSGGGLGVTLVSCNGPVVGDTDRDYASSLQEHCPE